MYSSTTNWHVRAAHQRRTANHTDPDCEYASLMWREKRAFLALARRGAFDNIHPQSSLTQRHHLPKNSLDQLHIPLYTTTSYPQHL